MVTLVAKSNHIVQSDAMKSFIWCETVLLALLVIEGRKEDKMGVITVPSLRYFLYTHNRRSHDPMVSRDILKAICQYYIKKNWNRTDTSNKMAIKESSLKLTPHPFLSLKNSANLQRQKGRETQQSRQTCCLWQLYVHVSPPQFICLSECHKPRTTRVWYPGQ